MLTREQIQRLAAKFPTQWNREFLRREQGICLQEQGILNCVYPCRERLFDRTDGLKKGEFVAHRHVHRSGDETANSIIEGTG